MSCHASCGHAVDSALHHAVKRTAGARHYSSLLSRDVAGDINLGGLSGAPRSRVEVVGLMVALTISAEEADPQSHVQSQPPGDVEVILEVWLQYLIAVVVLDPRVGLRIICDVAHQQICKRVTA